MSFETVEGTLNISCTMIMTTALAAILLLIGFWIRKKVSFLTKYCIPAPVVGGFLFMFITFAGHQSGAFALSRTASASASPTSLALNILMRSSQAPSP